MALLLIGTLTIQLRKRHYTPWAYWLTVVLVSIVGTQITDLFTDGLGVSLYISTPVCAVVLAIVFMVWYGVERTLSIHAIVSRRRELFYWAAILRSEEHTSELQSLMRSSYAVFCLNKKTNKQIV